MGVIQLLTAFAIGPPALIGGLGVLFGTLVCFIGQPGDWDHRPPSDHP
jgi:hypothetical protein